MTVDGAFEELAKAVVARLGQVQTASGVDLPPIQELDEFELLWWPNPQHPIPAMLCRPDPARDRDYQGTLDGLTKHMIRLEFHVDGADQTGAGYSEISRLTSKRGPVISRLRDDEIRDPLWDLCGLDVGLTDGRGWRMNRRKRLQADIGLVLGAN